MCWGGAFDVFLRRHGFKKLPMGASVPVYYQGEMGTNSDMHLLIGIETRSESNEPISRWTAMAVEVGDKDDVHLDLILKSHLHLQGKTAMMMLLELGQYLECKNACIAVPELKSDRKKEKYVATLAQLGFDLYDKCDAVPAQECMVYEYPTAARPTTPERQGPEEAF